MPKKCPRYAWARGLREHFVVIPSVNTSNFVAAHGVELKEFFVGLRLGRCQLVVLKIVEFPVGSFPVFPHLFQFFCKIVRQHITGCFITNEQILGQNFVHPDFFLVEVDRISRNNPSFQRTYMTRAIYTYIIP